VSHPSCWYCFFGGFSEEEEEEGVEVVAFVYLSDEGLFVRVGTKSVFHDHTDLQWHSSCFLLTFCKRLYDLAAVLQKEGVKAVFRCWEVFTNLNFVIGLWEIRPRIWSLYVVCFAFFTVVVCLNFLEIFYMWDSMKWKQDDGTKNGEESSWYNYFVTTGKGLEQITEEVSL
jgi:hypothetical protein